MKLKTIICYYCIAVIYQKNYKLTRINFNFITCITLYVLIAGYKPYKHF